MDLILTRNDYTKEGIFGTLTDTDGNFICVTAEHAYPSEDGHYAPKLNNGSHTCTEGTHTLIHHPAPFKAFQVMDVFGHTDILFHIGNYPQTDSEGCILVGSERNGDMIMDSNTTFEKFMELQKDVDSFRLTVL
jgi:hypothetical protein